MFVNGGTRNNNIHDNTFFNNQNQILVQGYQTTIRNNIFFARTSSQSCFAFYYDPVSAVSTIGTVDYNYYARPIADTDTIYRYWSGVKYTLAQWQSTYGHDTHSMKSPKTTTNLDDIRFEFNPTGNARTISLNGNYLDVAGTRYPGSVTIQPYKSIVLIKE
jgi:hypothetical protein